MLLLAAPARAGLTFEQRQLELDAEWVVGSARDASTNGGRRPPDVLLIDNE